MITKETEEISSDEKYRALAARYKIRFDKLESDNEEENFLGIQFLFAGLRYSDWMITNSELTTKQLLQHHFSQIAEITAWVLLKYEKAVRNWRKILTERYLNPGLNYQQNKHGNKFLVKDIRITIFDLPFYEGDPEFFKKASEVFEMPSKSYYILNIHGSSRGDL